MNFKTYGMGRDHAERCQGLGCEGQGESLQAGRFWTSLSLCHACRRPPLADELCVWRADEARRPDASEDIVARIVPGADAARCAMRDVRRKRGEAKITLAEGLDPPVERKMTAKARAIADGNTFEFVARRWHTLRKPNGSTVHGADVIESLENDIFPLIGDLPIRLVVAPKLLDVLNKVEERGAIETAHRLRQRVSSIFVYGIAAGLCDTDRAASLGKALRKKPRATKQPSIIDGIEDQDERIAQVRAVLGNCDNERCRALTKFALRLIALTAVRPNEVHGARWDEIEGIDRGKPDAPSPAALWRIGAARMKGEEARKADKAGDHLVPLAPEAVDLLRVVRRLSGDLPIVFPGERHAHRRCQRAP
ncbi:tyrosine-type recombinase/integrase [Sphingomonas aurantiaca]|uniref:tyrosine-type recombinase/integrase n=1 Tax=Sphingomonas aurantiaca TaxID=185949 RepID=UPI003CC6B0C2